MTVLGILGTPHTKGNTVLLLDAVLEGAAAAGAETQKAELARLDLRFCSACGRCYSTGSCIHDDGVAAVQKQMVDADGIVLASPNYMHSVTAQLKAFMDRCSFHVHCFLLSGKYGAGVATAGGSCEKRVAGFENEFLRLCGAQTVGIATALAAGPAALQDQDAALARARELGADLVAAIRERRQYPDQAEEHAAFSEQMRQLVTRMAQHAPFQYEYWEKMGWL